MSARAITRSALALAGLVALAACGGGATNNLAALDNSLAGNDADPALTSALEDQIMVDPTLAQQAHPNQARPPETPVQAQYPAGSAAQGARTRRATAAAGVGGDSGREPGACGARFQYGMAWAERLPAAFPAYPGGRITEAAGNDHGDCRIRVVTFTTADPWQRVIDFYRGVVQRGGYDAEQQQRGGDHVLGGVNAATDGAYYLIVTPKAQGSEVALIVNNGR
jgi:hypothetical protein